MIIVIKQGFDIVAVNIDRANVQRNKVLYLFLSLLKNQLTNNIGLLYL